MYVLLPWSQYYNLESIVIAPVCASFEAADGLKESCLDEIVEVDSDAAASELSAAFGTLCLANWTPNQDREEKDRNEERASDALAIIKKYSS